MAKTRRNPSKRKGRLVFSAGLEYLENRCLLSILPKVADGNFDMVSVGTGPNAFVYNPVGTPWAFSGNSGIAATDSSLVTDAVNPSDQSQVAFIQGNSSFAQTVKAPPKLTKLFDGYVVEIQYARGNSVGTNPEVFKVGMSANGTDLGALSFSATNPEFTTATIFASALYRSQTLKFEGNGNASNDSSVLIKDVRVLPRKTGGGFSIDAGLGDTGLGDLNYSTSITTGPDGGVWFIGGSMIRANLDGLVSNYIGRIDPETMAIDYYPIPVSQSQNGHLYATTSIIAGPNNSLWFTTGDDTRGGGIIGRINATTHQIQTNEIPFFGLDDTSYQPYRPVLSQNGTLWISCYDGFMAVNPDNLAITPYFFRDNTRMFEAVSEMPNGLGSVGIKPLGASGGTSLPEQGGAPFVGPVSPSILPDIVIPGGGINTFWFTDPSNNAIGKFQTSNRSSTLYRLPIQNAVPEHITKGPDGALWFTEQGIFSIGRFDPNTSQFSQYSLPFSPTDTPPVKLGNIIVGPDHAIWFNILPGYFHFPFNSEGGMIGRIDPESGKFSQYHSQSGSITAGPDDAIWCVPADSEPGPIGHIAVPSNIDILVDKQVSADNPISSLDAFVSNGQDSNGDPINSGNNTRVAWRVDGPGGTLDQTQNATSDGDASNVLHTSTKAGDHYKVYAKLVRLDQYGVTRPILQQDEVQSEEITVVPGQAANLTLTADDARLPSDGVSTTTIRFTATDAEGNLVANGTRVTWDLVGTGTLSNVQKTTTNGQATATLTSGVFPGTMNLTTTIGNVSATASVEAVPLNIQLGITGNFLTLGSSDTATITATVNDADGLPVADGTPITWFTPKGTIVGTGVVLGGTAQVTLLATGGSQSFTYGSGGYGTIRAFVGNAVGSVRYTWLPQLNGLKVQAVHRLLAGDTTNDSSVPVDQADGTTINYPVYAGTDVTITGPPNAVFQATIGGGPLSLGAGLLQATGDNGQSGSVVPITLNAQGVGTFRVQSTGAGSSYKSIVVPISIQGIYGTTLSTNINIAVQPKQYIGQALDYIGKLAWSVLAGPGDSPDEIAADMAFSFIPVIGVYSDIRDAASELLKLWPGGESPDWIAFGFAVAGIVAEVTPADVAVDAIKGVYKAAKVGIINPSGIIFRTSLQKLKGLGSQLATGGNGIIKSLDELGNTVIQLFPELFGKSPVLVGNIPLGTFVDKAVENADEFRALQTFMSVVDDFPKEVQGFATKYGQGTANNIIRSIDQLSDDAIKALVSAGKMDTVATGIAKGRWDQAKVDFYVNKVLPSLKGNPVLDQFDEFADVPGDLVYALHQAAHDKGVANELAMASILRSDGETLQWLRRSYVDSSADLLKRDVDIETATRMIEVKSNIAAMNSRKLNSMYVELDELQAFSKINGNKPVFLAGTVPFDQLKKKVVDELEKRGITSENYIYYKGAQ